VRFAYLHVPHDELARRMRSRDHFMPPSLLDSQLATLEEPAPEEHALYIHASGTPADVLAQTRRWLAEPAGAG
jgi:gluconokinase